MVFGVLLRSVSVRFAEARVERHESVGFNVRKIDMPDIDLLIRILVRNVFNVEDDALFFTKDKGNSLSITSKCVPKCPNTTDFLS